MILAIETATDVCSVAFEENNGRRFEKREVARGSHSEKMFLFIRALMDEHGFAVDDLDAVLVGRGPGSYTGLRIAASGVKGLLFGTEVPLWGCSTLASFAAGIAGEVPDGSTIHAIIDARRVHLYHRRFRLTGGRLEAVDRAETLPIKSFEKMVKAGDIIVGTGLERLDKEAISGAKTYGKEAVSARSLIDLYHRDGERRFLQEASPASFDPQYYTSEQAETGQAGR